MKAARLHAYEQPLQVDSEIRNAPARSQMHSPWCTTVVLLGQPPGAGPARGQTNSLEQWYYIITSPISLCVVNDPELA